MAKPLGSLGLLEDALIRIAALTGSADIDLSVRRLYLMCADNGVVAQNVTQTGSEVTARMADSFAAGKSSACRMAKVANCQVEAVDLGILNCRAILESETVGSPTGRRILHKSRR